MEQAAFEEVKFASKYWLASPSVGGGTIRVTMEGVGKTHQVESESR